MKKADKVAFIKYLAESIDPSGYDKKPESLNMYDRFIWFKHVYELEYGHHEKRFPHRGRTLEDYLRGLPSSLTVETYDNEIINRYTELTCKKVLSSKEEYIVDNWFPMLGNLLDEIFNNLSDTTIWLKFSGEKVMPRPNMDNISDGLKQGLLQLKNAMTKGRNIVITKEVSLDKLRKYEYRIHVITEHGKIFTLSGNVTNENDVYLLNLTKYGSSDLGFYYANELSKVLLRCAKLIGMDNTESFGQYINNNINYL